METRNLRLAGERWLARCVALVGFYVQQAASPSALLLFGWALALGGARWRGRRRFARFHDLRDSAQRARLVGSGCGFGDQSESGLAHVADGVLRRAHSLGATDAIIGGAFPGWIAMGWRFGIVESAT